MRWVARGTFIGAVRLNASNSMTWKRGLTVVGCVANSPTSSDQLHQLEASFARMLATARSGVLTDTRLGYCLEVADLPVVPRVMLSQEGGSANGNLSPTEDGTGIGIEINHAALSLEKLGKEFIIGHELGHAYARHVLSEQGLLTPSGDLQPGLSVGVHEVVADLCAVQLLRAGLLYSHNELVQIGTKAIEWGLFDLGWSGQHPPGFIRGRAVIDLLQLLQAGQSFPVATKQLLVALPIPSRSKL